VLAQRTPRRPSRDALLQAANAIEEKWGLPAPKWLKVFKPLTQ
jgi:spermidine synthase